MKATSPGPVFWRLPLLALGMLSLACAVWGGLVRLGWPLPLPAGGVHWVAGHGPLVVGAFLGIVISLERAVGLPDRWTYAAPALTALSAVPLLSGFALNTGAWLLTAGSAAFVLVTARVVQLRRELFTVTMHLAAVAWCAGNGLMLAGRSGPELVPWWIAFLGLTIVGERIDLSRFQKPVPVARPLLLLALAGFIAGVVVSAWEHALGLRVAGAGLVALAAWLARFDLARRTVRQPGLPRFMSLCLLGGFAWLGVAGGLLAWLAPVSAGFHYDAALHAFFLGFVFTMIFGHAPVIFPSVLGLPMAYHGRFYLHLILLHVSLAVRIAADLGEWPVVRKWAGVGNALSLLLFLANLGSAILLERWRSRKRRT